MSVFKGTIRLGDGDADGLETSLTADSGRLVVVAGNHEIGNWAVEELSVKRRNGEFRINVEGEELLVAVADPVGLSQALGIEDRKEKQRRSEKPKVRKRKRKQQSQPEASPQPAVTITEPPAAPTYASPVAAPTYVPPVAATSEGESPQPRPSLWSRLPKRVKLAGIGVIALMIFGVLAPSVLALVLLLVGMVTLFLGIAARSDSSSSVMPPPFFATTAAAAGGIGMVLLAVVIIAIT